jgi:hypothetical protein
VHSINTDQQYVTISLEIAAAVATAILIGARAAEEMQRGHRGQHERAREQTNTYIPIHSSPSSKMASKDERQ